MALFVCPKKYLSDEVVPVPDPEPTPTPTPDPEPEPDIPTPDPEPNPDPGAVYTQGFRDLTVIPDLWNTGCDESKLEYTIGTENVADMYTLFGIDMREDGQIRFAKAKNLELPTEVVVENVRFTLKPNYIAVTAYSELHTFIFKNCKFDAGFATGSKTPGATNMVFTKFYDCTFPNFSGVDAELHNCFIGNGDHLDGLRIDYNVSVYDCYVANLLPRESNTSGAHVDGCQIYNAKLSGNQVIDGKDRYEAGDIHFYNTRIEMPDINYPVKGGGVTGCLYTENQSDFLGTFEVHDCIVNGGSYCLYIGNSSYELNGVMENVWIGDGRRYGMFYPVQNDISNITKTDCIATPTLYVSSVKKENGEIRALVTNDTKVERTLMVRTDSGDRTYTIRKFDNFEDTTDFKDMWDYPIDIEVSIPEDSSFVVFFDNTNGDMAQIRYVQFEG
ncbi:MAG: hypothetical protein J6U54_22400 [Clostridiales bacterium]|nr:hypothetical protein [Clostridiales bacterium]